MFACESANAGHAFLLEQKRVCAKMCASPHFHWTHIESNTFVRSRIIMLLSFANTSQPMTRLFRRKEESLRTPANAVHAFSLEERREPCESTLRPNRTSNI
jgi:hypothetical protein